MEKLHEFVFETLSEMNSVIEEIKQLYEDYALVYRADILEFMGKESSFKDCSISWTNIDIKTDQRDGKYILIMPKID